MKVVFVILIFVGFIFFGVLNDKIDTSESTKEFVSKIASNINDSAEEIVGKDMVTSAKKVTNDLADKASIFFEKTTSSFSKKQKYEYMMKEAICDIPLKMVDFSIRMYQKDGKKHTESDLIELNNFKKLAQQCLKGGIKIKINNAKVTDNETLLNAEMILVKDILEKDIMEKVKEETLLRFSGSIYGINIPIRARIKTVLGDQIIDSVCLEELLLYPLSFHNLKAKENLRCPLKNWEY